MPTLQLLFAKADRAVIRVGAWITFFGVVWSTMTWIASSIPVIVPYGWGVAVFAGLGAACVLSLVMSAGLVSWRYFHPIAPNPAASTSKADPTRVRHEADT